MITILIVDDHAVVRQGVQAFLDTQPDMTVIAETGSGAEALEIVKETPPDVILMDLLMPEMDGVEATRRIKSVSPRSEVIVLTSYHKDEHIFPAIRAGALSYILKDAGPEELADVVRKAANGEAVLHSRVASRVVKDMQGLTEDGINPFTELTDREMEVIKLIADGMTNAAIAEELVITERTVKSHVSNILSKLHLNDRTEAAVYAWREGIVRRDD